MNLSNPASFARKALLGLACSLCIGVSADENVTLLAFGDWGYSNSEQQQACARQMNTYADGNQVKFSAALLLGDNFYHKLPGGVNDPRWQVEFEQAYDPAVLDMPFYAALGNHDYEGNKVQTQLAYARRHPEGRWKMPAKWYRIDLPADDPMVSVLVLDSNFKRMTKREWKEQMQWLREELERPRETSWLIAAAHHPLYSEGMHGDTRRLKADWGELFNEHQLDFYLCGHDHDLQHLEIPGQHTSFLLAGGGGAKVRPIKRHDRGPFTLATNGFLVLHLTPELATGEFITSAGESVHTFRRPREAQVAPGSSPPQGGAPNQLPAR